MLKFVIIEAGKLAFGAGLWLGVWALCADTAVAADEASSNAIGAAIGAIIGAAICGVFAVALTIREQRRDATVSDIQHQHQND